MAFTVVAFGIVHGHALAGTDDIRVETDETSITLGYDFDNDVRSVDLSLDYGMTDGIQVAFDYTSGRNTFTTPDETFREGSVSIEWWPFTENVGSEIGLKLAIGQEVNQLVPEGESRTNFRNVSFVMSWGNEARSLDLEFENQYSRTDDTSTSGWGVSATFGIALSDDTEFQLELGDSEDGEPYTDIAIDYEYSDRIDFSISARHEVDTISTGLSISYSF